MIEERAGNFADNFTSYDSPVLANLLHYVAKDGYIKGATEQREIDIDRAWQWHKSHKDGVNDYEDFKKYMTNEND